MLQNPEAAAMHSAGRVGRVSSPPRKNSISSKRTSPEPHRPPAVHVIYEDGTDYFAVADHHHNDNNDNNDHQSNEEGVSTSAAAAAISNELLRPSSHYARIALETKKREEAARRQRMNRHTTTSATGSSSRHRPLSSSTPTPTPPSSLSPRAARHTRSEHIALHNLQLKREVDEAGEQLKGIGPRFVDDTSPQPQQQKVSSIFSSTQHRLSYLPCDVQRNVSKVASKQNARACGVIGSHVWPSVHNIAHPTQQQKHHPTTTTTTTSSSSPSPQNNSSTRRHFVSHVSPGLHSTAASLFSVPHSDESVPPMSNIHTRPARIDTVGTGPSSPARNHHQHHTAQQNDMALFATQARFNQNFCTSPARTAAMFQSLETATFKYDEDEDGGGGAVDKSESMFLGSPTSMCLLNGAAGSNASFSTAGLLDGGSGSGARAVRMQELLSKQLAQRYVETFKAMLSTSGISMERWTSQLSLETRDAYMCEWKCGALMRRVVLEDFDALEELAAS